MNTVKKNIKKLAPVLIVFVTLILLIPKQAHGGAAQTVADLLGISAIAGSVIAWVAYVINYLIATIAGIFIALITYFIEVILQLNTHIVQATVVEKGFAVTLALANLGFVLGIIVIAIATILRRETYGIKQILWKLIVMAILVNFSLVIASAILSFADQLALFFLNNINPATTGGTINPFGNFANALAGAFTPQRGFMGMSITSSTEATLQNSSGLAGAAGQSLSGVLGPLISIVFVALFIILALIVLTSFLIMLLIRYIYLGILLILMPLAWMCWVFPALSSYWQKWWHNFVKWTFFAPIVVFFLYLVILTSDSMAVPTTGTGPAAAFQGLGYQPSSNEGRGAVAAISAVVGGFTNQLVGTILQMTLMLGLTIGGLFAANSMGIAFAKTAMGAAQGVGKGFGGYVGRRAKQIGTRPLRGEWGQKAAARLQQAGAGTGIGSRALRYTGLAWAGRRLGRGIEAGAVAGGAKMIDEARERTKGMTIDQKIHGLTTANAPEKIAWLKEIKDAGRLGEVSRNDLEKYVGEDKKDEFNRYQSGKLREELDKESGLEFARKTDQWRKEGKTDEQIRTEAANYLRTAPNAGQLAEMFFVNIDRLREKAAQEGKTLNEVMPLKMDEADIQNLQQVIVGSVGRGFSPSNLSNFFQKLSRGDQLDQFRDAARTLHLAENDINDFNQQWLTSSGARNMGVTREIFGLGPPPRPQPPPPRP